MRGPEVPGVCEKRAYRSAASARAATRKIKNRVAVYLCGECHYYHVTNRDTSRRKRFRRRSKSRRTERQRSERQRRQDR